MERIHVKAECRFSGTAHKAVVLHTDVLMIGLRERYRRRLCESYKLPALLSNGR